MTQPITVRQRMLDELGDEESRTLRTLERVPGDRFDWAPHEKSMPMGRLAVHVATLPRIGVTILTTSEFDMAASRGDGPPPPTRAEDLVPAAQALFHQLRERLAQASDADLDADWTFRVGDHTLFGPGARAVALRTFCLSHIVHHRAQLGVYLRLSGVPVPAIYGPSADEPIA